MMYSASGTENDVLRQYCATDREWTEFCQRMVALHNQEHETIQAAQPCPSSTASTSDERRSPSRSYRRSSSSSCRTEPPNTLAFGSVSTVVEKTEVRAADVTDHSRSRRRSSHSFPVMDSDLHALKDQVVVTLANVSGHVYHKISTHRWEQAHMILDRTTCKVSIEHDQDLTLSSSPAETTDRTTSRSMKRLKSKRKSFSQFVLSRMARSQKPKTSVVPCTLVYQVREWIVCGRESKHDMGGAFGFQILGFDTSKEEDVVLTLVVQSKASRKMWMYALQTTIDGSKKLKWSHRLSDKSPPDQVQRGNTRSKTCHRVHE
jgi:hypothetical protein